MNQETFDRHFEEFKSQCINLKRPIPLEADKYFIPGDDTETTTQFDFGYVMHCSWAARILAKTRPAHHADFGSSVFFAGVISAFQPNFTFYDFRPPYLPLSGLEIKKINLTDLQDVPISYESVSCLHVLEHVGMGRYGDPIDAVGDLRAAIELSNIVKKDGQIIFAAPVNQIPTIRFNAHRVYSFGQVLNMFPFCHLKEFSLISDSLHENVAPESISGEAGREEIGCFHFIKL